MKIASIQAIRANVSSFNAQAKKNQSINNQTNVVPFKQTTVPTGMYLAQMPNVSFKGNDIDDNLNAYNNYSGGPIPAIEMDKYSISVRVNNAIESGDYIEAIKGKIALSRICKNQGKETDAFMLEEGIRRLYTKLEGDEKTVAKYEIRRYNKDMADYIDEDVKKL